MANLNTPINKWDLPGTPEGFEVFIKRDDMTGSTLSGNKVFVSHFDLMLIHSIDFGTVWTIEQEYN